ncbi:WD40/YVTN/BNR-like repeat-containing protein [Candidatus Palauibacter sp.]|uniref:WD40/YVTN/BNR-like repeat-containing protein n=1 Tax=Candidatus Palauibacter sp. TaxID=3101350 RepID=UPI003B52B89C
MRDLSRRRRSRAWLVVVLGVVMGGPGVLPPLTPEVRAQEVDQSLATEVVAGLPLREIGPAVMGGRIADIAVHPHRSSTWYVAAGSGGLWKTTNAGVTWDPVFEDQPVYSIGDVAIDPNNPDVIWVGSGENVSGRHVGWGDGVYRSRNGGETWENVGLPNSQHIGKILVDPRDSRVVLVAAEGSLWAPGGDRGVYRSTDGGDSWALVLGIDENTGVTDIEFAPGDPNVVYAAAYERRRKIWGHLAGGPNSGIYKSTDGGENWRRISAGLPAGDVGKIGLAVTPANPEVVYATMEAGDDERGFYRSLDKGEGWEKRNSYISGGTGPHYYQEIEASPHDADIVYQMDVFIQVTRDGGATFGNLETANDKHSDNHALWIDPEDGQHLIVGTDAGLYETFDDGRTFRHFPNLPISQFYKLALDTAEPFYNVLGGAQDLGTLWGPARTMNVEGIRNRDWYAPMGADGYAVQIDPRDPDILYLQTQQGNLYRYDRMSEEALDIQPQPAPGDPPERFNWDAPILISPHDADRIYHGSQRVWRSDDRGNSWTAISGDLTTDVNRYELQFMGRVWSVDDLIDNGAMSKYATLTGISESPVAEGVIYTGSDDGLIHVTEDAGATWRRAAELPGVPERAFINDVEASQHDPATVFAVADNHKEGDFRPLVFESNDRGLTWRSISGDLPAGTTAWAIEQDHLSPNLLFLGAEFGMYVSVNGGANWHMLPGPTISHRDLEIQRRDNDVVGATFGRGFYVLDDYTPLRELAGGATTAMAAAEGGALFPVRDAWWYIPSVPMQARGKPTLGTDDYTAPNPDFGATLTYYLPETLTTTGEARRDAEGEVRAAGGDVPFPGYDVLNAEATESGPRALVAIADAVGRTVRWVTGPASQGLHRVSWDLRAPAPDPIDLTVPGFTPPWVGPPQGHLTAPGDYSAQLVVVTAEGAREVGLAQTFAVRAVPTAEAGTDFGAVVAFQSEASELMRRISSAGEELGRARDRLRHMRAALLEAPAAPLALFGDLDALDSRLQGYAIRIFGDPARQRLNESTVPSISNRVGRVIGGHWDTRQTPTATHRRNLEIGETDFGAWLAEFEGFMSGDFMRAEAALEAAGAPWTPGRRPPGG